MTKNRWKASPELIRLFQAVGKTLLQMDLEDSHSGNIAMRWTDKKGHERLAITSTGSQKGDLKPEHICLPSIEETDFGYYKASSEADIHARIVSLEGVKASIHAHTKDLTIVTLDEEDKPNKPKDFIPIDPLGYYHLGGRIPVDWVEVPSGSAEMTQIIPERLSQHPAAVIQGHGTFVKGKSLKEALFLSCIANNSGYIHQLARRQNTDIGSLIRRIESNPDTFFSDICSEYSDNRETTCDFPKEEELVEEFHITGRRIFESHLSPFHTGSISVRGVRTMFFAPKASMPDQIGGPLLEVPLDVLPEDTPELRTHKAIYRESNFQTIIHCYVPEAEAHAHFIYPDEDKPTDRIVAIDAEGSFLYLVIPVVPPKEDHDRIIKLLHDYRVVVVRGGGVWAVGEQSLSEVLHHPSSVREICLYRIGAHEQGLDLRKLEPEKAKKW
ncbi:MAG: class II aldolase/adducin family protein [Candidatus Aminicenantes bacterium]|jgi:ribulose-5-phosphate 4-epimerase/fuculose-1-phosphate aldolase